ncbi:MAG: carboxypeptidase regulatory-like domain-containing protein [Armatimonadetes bacterium]|nr:carboxypeptidase regulatory-like domain-containing protein [Armatimonadota bacterium]
MFHKQHQQTRRRRRGKPFRRSAAVAGLCALSVSAAVAPARAAANRPAAAPRGAFCGQIIDAATGKAIPDATVVLRDRSNKVVAWTRTDAQGRYTLAGNSLELLDLESHRRGVLATLGRGVVQVVQFPINVAGAAAGAVVGVAVDTVKAVDPVGTVKAAAIGAAEGNPMPLATKATQDVEGLVGVATQKKAHDSAVQARNHTVETTVNGTPAPGAKANAASKQPGAAPKKEAPGPGEVALLVSAPQYKEFQGPAGSYWVQPPGAGSAPAGPQAWLDTVRLAPTTAKQDSDTQDQAAHLSDPTLDPVFAAAGSPVRITVKLQLPAEPAETVRVVAREQKTHRLAELTPQGNGVYAGVLTLDPKTPTGDTTVTVAALNAAPVGINLRADEGKDPLLAFAAGLDDLDAVKPYRFDPRTLASENRLDLKMTVLDPSKEMPPPPAAPAPANPPAPQH